jgi:hypothetical protein
MYTLQASLYVLAFKAKVVNKTIEGWFCLVFKQLVQLFRLEKDGYEVSSYQQVCMIYVR